MAADPDSDSGFDEELPEAEAADELFLAEPEEEASSATPEVELLNDVTQHYLNEIGAAPGAAVGHGEAPVEGCGDATRSRT